MVFKTSLSNPENECVLTHKLWDKRKNYTKIDSLVLSEPRKMPRSLVVCTGTHHYWAWVWWLKKTSVPSHLAWFSYRMAEANAAKLKRAELKKMPGGPDSPIHFNDMPRDCPDFYYKFYSVCMCVCVCVFGGWRRERERTNKLGTVSHSNQLENNVNFLQIQVLRCQTSRKAFLWITVLGLYVSCFLHNA